MLPSDRPNRSRRRGGRILLPALCFGTIVVLATNAGTDPPAFDSIRPVAPDDGAVSRARPVFRIAYEGVADVDVRRMRFRLALSSDRFASERYMFDQQLRRTGWGLGEVGEVIFRPPAPLDDASYQWRVSAWNGVEWVTGGGTRELRIDSVAPAEVEGLRMKFDADSQTLTLRWNPVTLDLNGRPEFVARYYVYRYDRKQKFRAARPFEIAVVEIPEFVARGSEFIDDTILFYKIVAEDEAGNVTERRQ